MPLEKVGVRAVVEGVSGYVRDANKIDRSTASMGRGVQGVASKFKLSTTQALRFGAAIVGVQLGISVMARSIIGLQQSTIGAAIAFESSFAGIRKTMQLTEEEFAKLARANRDLAKEIPVTVNELNRIGELAGQLGVRGVANVLEFEATIAKLAVTTNLSAETAALALAQFASVLQIPQNQIDNIGSAIVGLGNNFETVESKIVDFGRRIAGAGKIAGLTAGDIFGIGTAFASVGVEAERGGTAIQQTLLAMQKAVLEGGQTLEIFAAVANTTTEEFTTLFREDAAEAFTLFVEGLGEVGEQGFKVLDALGLAGQRLIGSFLNVAGAGDKLRRAITQGNEEFEANVALQKEAEQRFETTASKLQLLRNGFADIGIEAGNALLVGLEPLLQATQEWLDTNGDQFARDLADAIEGGIDFAHELANEIGRLAEFLQDLSDIGVVEIALDVAELTGKDKLVLTLAAATLGLLTFGPQGALIAGGVTLGGLTLADFFGRGPGADIRPTGAAGPLAAEQLTPRHIADVIRARARGTRFAGPGGVPFELSDATLSELSRTLAGFPLSMIESTEDFETFSRVLLATLGETPGDVEEAVRTAFRFMRGASTTGRFPSPFPPGGAPPGEEEEGGPRELPESLFVDPKDAEREAARRRRALEKLASDAEAARDRLRREQLTELDTFGDLLIAALRGRAQRELDVTMDTIAEEREARQDAHRDRLRQIDDTLDAALDALRQETDARVAALDAELGLLDEEQSADRRAELERELALAFEEQDRAEVLQRIRDFERDERRGELRDEIRDVRDAARDREAELRDQANAAMEIARDEHEQELRLLDEREQAARTTFEQITDDWALESEARRLLMEEENAAIAQLLNEQGDLWRTSGIAFGESLVDGIRSQLEPFLASIFAQVPGTGAASVAAANRQRDIAAHQEQGKTLKAGGAPDFVLEQTRQRLIDLFGVVPQFPHGGIVGAGGERVPIFVEPGELILNQAQQAAMLSPRTVFERGAFEGMLSGATFSGDPRSNARAIRAEFDDLIDDQLGRGAFIAGAGG